MTRWHLITGEYPPDPGGVGDYTRRLAQELIRAGDHVDVWTRGEQSEPRIEDGVTVHRVAGRFGPRGLQRLSQGLDRCPGPRRLLLQYVPQAYGFKGLNTLVLAWLMSRSGRDEVRATVHEVATPWMPGSVRGTILAVGTRFHAALLMRSARQLYVTIPAWGRLLRQLGGSGPTITWTPVPATIPALEPQPDPEREIVGHFGTYGRLITPSLAPIVEGILRARPTVTVRLIGAGSREWREHLAQRWPELAPRIEATGALPAEEVARALTECRVMVQPYVDGASTRRTTLMAALANGVPVVTTLGRLSEPIWQTGGVVAIPISAMPKMIEAVHTLLNDPQQAKQLGESGRRLYRAHFDWPQTIRALREVRG